MLRRRVYLHAWRLLPGLALLLTMLMLLLSNLPERLDLVLYDLLLRVQYQAPNERVMIVAIDEPSLQVLGRWPWSRRVHARLLDKLTEAEVQAVGFDILFAESETDDPTADRQFARAIQRNGRVVLAVAPGTVGAGNRISEILPLPALAEKAAALAHVDFELDSDGISRGLFLWAGLGDAHWPAFALALAELAEPHGRNPYTRSPDRGSEDPALQNWVRDQLMLIPFVDPQRRFHQVSYLDVLSGKVPAARLRGRIILIGYTASGLGDAPATPVSWRQQRTPGVVMNAHALNALLEHGGILPLTTHSRLLLSLGFLVGLYLAFIYLPGRYMLWIMLGGVAAVLSCSLVLLIGFHRWFPPVALLLALGLSYPLWSWYQLESASRALRRLEHRIRHQARHDPVTRLPNREMLQEDLQQAIAEADLHRGHLGLLILSLDRFREINNRLGLKGGDLLLNRVAERLRKVVRDNDVVARLGSDEFALLMVDLQDEKPLIDMAGRLLYTFRHPLEVAGQEFILCPSIGANLHPQGGRDSESLLHNTYTAMQKAKHDKAREFWFYDEGIKIQMLARNDLENALNLALQHGEFELFYQPQVSAVDTRIVGVEALLRWHRPRHADIPPAEFIPLAEGNGQIIPIGKWVLEQACHQAQQWRREGLAEIRMAVNLSAVQFSHPYLVDDVAEILQASGLPPHLLELELTETSLMRDMYAANATLTGLKALGIQLAIDDFGTGYSSLSYLKSFPMDRIKIDRCFVSELEANPETAEITLAIIDMAHRLKLSVIAEGVETPAQQHFLRRHRCHQLQGYLFGRPVCAAELTHTLRQTLGHSAARAANE